MRSFEDIICPSAEDKEAFQLECRDVFNSPSGRRILARLCMAAHPLQHTPGMSDHEHGRREVVATLWRFGSVELLPPEPTTPPT